MDDLDRAADYAELERVALINNRPGAEILPGKPGECELCGSWSGRLVDGACVPCRNRLERRR